MPDSPPSAPVESASINTCAVHGITTIAAIHAAVANAMRMVLFSCGETEKCGVRFGTQLRSAIDSRRLKREIQPMQFVSTLSYLYGGYLLVGGIMGGMKGVSPAPYEHSHHSCIACRCIFDRD